MNESVETCRFCGESHPLSSDIWRVTNSGFRDRCKPCWNAYMREYNRKRLEERGPLPPRSRVDEEELRRRRNERARQRYHKDPEAGRAARRDRYAAEPEKYKERERQRRLDNPERIREMERQQRLRNPEAYRATDNARYERDREKRKEAQRRIRAADPEGHRERDRARNSDTRRAQARARRRLDPIRYSLGSAIARNLKSRGSSKEVSFLALVDWTMDELRAHLSELFEPGMSFDNYGEWALDHIIPQDAVEYSGPADPKFRALWGLGNLAPLWFSDNSQKHARLDWQLPDNYVNPKLRAMYDNRNLELLSA